MFSKKWLRSGEFFVSVIIVVLSAIISINSPVFLSAANLIDLLKSSTVWLIFAACTYMVIVSGGIDVSFPGIAVFSMFATTKLLTVTKFDGPIIVYFLIAIAIGALLGCINGLFIAKFELPTLIVTLGTQSLFTGFLLTFVGSREISNVPAAINDFSKMSILTVENNYGGVTSLPFSILISVAVVFGVYFMMRHTKFGRGIFAIGGDVVSAERIGFNIVKTRFTIYVLVGALAGLAGMLHTCMYRNSNPVDMQGIEMIIIAAVVLGGTRITGGHGTMFGTILGLTLIIIINNSLILLGIPSYWQKFMTGLLILIGTGITAYQQLRSRTKKKRKANATA